MKASLRFGEIFVIRFPNFPDRFPLRGNTRFPEVVGGLRTSALAAAAESGAAAFPQTRSAHALPRGAVRYDGFYSRGSEASPCCRSRMLEKRLLTVIHGDDIPRDGDTWFLHSKPPRSEGVFDERRHRRRTAFGHALAHARDGGGGSPHSPRENQRHHLPYVRTLPPVGDGFAIPNPSYRLK